MRDYELSVLFHPDLEMNLDPALDKVRKLVETSGGKITKEEPEGKKRLTYPIAGHDFAIYYYFDVQLPPEAPAKISNTLGITEEVIRSMIVKADPRRAKYLAAMKESEKAESEGSSDEKAGEASSERAAESTDKTEDKTEEKSSEAKEV